MSAEQISPIGNIVPLGPFPSVSFPGLAPRSVATPLFVVAFVAALGGCSRTTPTTPSTQPDRRAESIRRVFEQDRGAGDKFKQGVKTDRLAVARAYVQAIRGIDLRSCPPDFQEAFLKHRYAWDELPPCLEKYAGFTGDLLSLMEFGEAIIKNRSFTTEGERDFERIKKEIKRTYFEVERTALKYGEQPFH